MPDADKDAGQILIERLAEALWSQTPHGDTGDLGDLPDAMQAEFRRRAENIKRRLLAAGVALTHVTPPGAAPDPVAEFIAAERALHADGCLYPEDDCTCR